jgi:ligand-binding SRPBCC domain-containing protein
MIVTRVFESKIDCPVESLWEFHSSAEALKILTPPGRKIEVLSEDLEVREGALHVLRVRQFGIPLVWKARISEVDPPMGFTDTAERSPFKSWRHRHEFISAEGGSILRDTVTYEAPFGPFGDLARVLFIDRDIKRLFAYRHDATRQALVPVTGT